MSINSGSKNPFLDVIWSNNTTFAKEFLRNIKMETKTKNKKCRECGDPIDDKVLNYSKEHYQVSLCRKCQEKLKKPLSEATTEAKGLYFRLRAMGVQAELEKWDGHKHIDIAVETAKLYIEIDGVHHNTSPKQAVADLRRTYYSFKDKYFTLRIPNALIHDDDALDEAVDLIAEIANIGAEQRQKRIARSPQKNQQSKELLSRILSRIDD
jgi:very-short-patch-repair endonuclease